VRPQHAQLTEHVVLALGVLRDGEGPAAEVLAGNGVTLEATRAKVMELLASR
jgi:hypothetical protein